VGKRKQTKKFGSIFRGKLSKGRIVSSSGKKLAESPIASSGGGKRGRRALPLRKKKKDTPPSSLRGKRRRPSNLIFRKKRKKRQLARRRKGKSFRKKKGRRFCQLGKTSLPPFQNAKGAKKKGRELANAPTGEKGEGAAGLFPAQGEGYRRLRAL